MIMPKLNKHLIFYAFFSLAALLFFLYARFPDKVVEKYLLDSLAERNSGTFVSVRSVGLSFPPGLKAEEVLFGFRSNPDSLIRLESLMVRPRLIGYLAGHASFAIRAAAYGGLLKGRVDFPHLRPEGSFKGVDLRFEDLTLEKCDYLKEKLGRQISGKLGGAFTSHGDSQLDFTIQNGSYQLLDNLLGFNRLDFSKIEGQLQLKGQVLKINKLRLTGDKISLSLKGDMILNPEFRNSELNLNGTMEVAALNNKKISLAVTGTIGNAKSRYQ